MSKKTKATVILFIIAMTITGMAFPASAAKNIWKYIGDADLDGTVTIVDATAIQRYLAGMIVFNRLETVVADVNENNEVDILDATIIQKELAQLDSGLKDENNNVINATYQLFYYEVSNTELSVAFEGDCIKVGEPVFIKATAKTPKSLLPISYEYRIHDCEDENIPEKVIRPRSDNSECIYAFDKPGEYLIDVYAYNTADIWSMVSERVYVSQS